MSLENEYLHLTQELKSEEEKLAKFESLDETKMDEMQIEAKERGIRLVKSSIKEIKDLIEEVKTELKEFIENGGEVSQKTIDELKEDTEEFETITINFKVLSNNNEKVYIEGYVEINDEEAEDVDWYYWTGNGYQSRPFYHHNKEEITGLTDIQNNEIDTFKNDYMDDALWIDTAIVMSNEEDKDTFVRENCTLMINGGK